MQINLIYDCVSVNNTYKQLKELEKKLGKRYSELGFMDPEKWLERCKNE